MEAKLERRRRLRRTREDHRGCSSSYVEMMILRSAEDNVEKCWRPCVEEDKEVSKLRTVAWGEIVSRNMQTLMLRICVAWFAEILETSSDVPRVSTEVREGAMVGRSSIAVQIGMDASNKRLTPWFTCCMYGTRQCGCVKRVVT